MRTVVQRVVSASVSVEGRVISSIGRGICVLIGLSRDDQQKDVDFIVKKLLNLRIFENESGRKWDKSVADLQLEILCVSQFTLMASTKKNRPDYHLSMGPDVAPSFYQNFLNQLKVAYKADLVKDGQFGAYMQVQVQNDGPVTICLDSQKDPNGSSEASSSQE